MGTTPDRDDPRLTHGVDEHPVPMAEAYLVLSDEERAKGFVRPVRETYRHAKRADQPASVAAGCGAVTFMGRSIAETYARDPAFYGATYCAGCRMHRPLAEFVWVPDGSVVGS